MDAQLLPASQHRHFQFGRFHCGLGLKTAHCIIARETRGSGLQERTQALVNRKTFAKDHDKGDDKGWLNRNIRLYWKIVHIGEDFQAASLVSFSVSVSVAVDKAVTTV
ncbi:MAG: hypothetical protein ACP5MD_14205 [Verrucomicrobiia bacterium]